MSQEDAPRIKTIWFQDYQPLQDTTLHLHPSMTILVGESGSGKSLALYEILKTLKKKSTALFSVTRGDDGSTSATIGMALSSGTQKPPLAYHEVDAPDGEDFMFWAHIRHFFNKATPSTRAAVMNNATELVGAPVHITSQDYGELFSVGGGPPLQLRFHSAGIRHLLKIAVGVTLRSAELDDPERAQVVILDDLDRELNPSHQVGLLGKLVSLFPGVQWVLSTRSPTIIGESKPDMVRILDDGAVYLPGNTYGKSVSDILRDVFGVQDRVEPVRTKILELGRLCDGPDVDAAAAALSELENLLGSDDTDLMVPRWALRLKRRNG